MVQEDIERRRRFKRVAWSALLVCAILFVLPIVWRVLSGSLDPNSMLEPFDPTSLGSLKSVSVRFLDDATASQSSGHAHSPFGTRGSDTYVYDGRLVTGDQEGRLKIEDYYPIAAVQDGERTLLLVRGYFQRNADLFRWFARKSDSAFAEISAKELSRDTWYLRFADPIDSYQYRTCMLKKLGESAGASAALEYFDALVAVDPACFRLKYSSGWDSPSNVNYGKFLCDVVAKSKDPRFAPSLIKVLYSFGPDDIQLDVYETYTTLLAVDATNGCEEYRKYRKFVLDQNIKDDRRVGSLQDDAEMLKRYDCEDPSPTTQPTNP